AGDEQAWWKAAGIDPVKVARQLWRQTRLDDRQERHQAGLAARPETPSIASAPDGTSESRPDQVATGRADGGRAPGAARPASSMPQPPPGSFTQATAPALPISSSTATGKPGRCAASAFRPGCASNTTSAPGTRRARPR